MIPLPLVLEKFVDYCIDFYKTHEANGVAAFLAGWVAIVLAVVSVLD